MKRLLGDQEFGLNGSRPGGLGLFADQRGLLAGLVAAAMLAGCSFAPTWPPMPIPDTLTREQVESFRSREEERLQAALRECYQRFAVNDCRHEALTRHREVLHQLRAQELRLNALEREERQRKLQANPETQANPAGGDASSSTRTAP